MGSLLPRQLSDRDPAPTPELLTEEDVLVWSVPLDGEPPSDWPALLSPAERERAEAFADPTGRTRYLLTRVALHRILGGLLGLDPARVEIGVAPGGKPILLPVPERRIEFNHTHAEGLALIAVAVGRPVGIDVEKAGRLADFKAIAERFFSKEEKAFLAQELGESRFFGLWTRKEAVLKAVGTGLSGGMNDFSVTAEGCWAPSVVCRGVRHAVREIAVPEGYAGALAVADRAA